MMLSAAADSPIDPPGAAPTTDSSHRAKRPSRT